MHAKKPLLETIGRELDVTVKGVENYSHDVPSVIVANHTCMTDIFSLSSALPEASQIVLSARLMWKRSTVETELRRLMIENALYGIPLEVHGGEERLSVGRNLATQALKDGWSVVIFPEGAYTGDNQVTRGRTGATRILYDALQDGVETHLLPVSIDTKPDKDCLDSHLPNDTPTTITIGQPIDVAEHFETFVNSNDRTTQRAALRAPIDLAMRAIAESANQPYVDEYIFLRARDTVILESGEEVSVEDLK